MNIDRDPNHLFPESREILLLEVLPGLTAWAEIHLKGYVPSIAEGFRSVARQQELFAQGRTAPGPVVTGCDGVRNRSRHQLAIACDIAWLHDGELTWDVPEAAWQQIQHQAHLAGLTSGKDWKMNDQPHVQMPGLDPMTEDGRALRAEADDWVKESGLV